MVQCSKLPAWKVGDRGFEPHAGLQVSKKQSVSSPLTRKDSVCLHDRAVAHSTSDFQGSNFKFCVWRAVLSHSFHHPQVVFLTQLSIHVQKGGIKHPSFILLDSKYDLRVRQRVNKFDIPKARLLAILLLKIKTFTISNSYPEG